MIWGNSSSAALRSLHTAINKVLRIMTFAPFGNIDLHPIYDFLDIMNLEQMFHFELGKYLYKSNHDLIPTSAIGNYFKPDPYVNNHSYGLRSRTANVPTRLDCRTKQAEKSIQINGLKFWNKIPETIRKSSNINIFKKSFRKFIIESSENEDDDLF